MVNVSKRAPARSLSEYLAIGMSKAEEVGDCLEWQGPFHQHVPIVRVRFEGKNYSDGVQVPRKLWEAANGPVPDGKLAYRSCCNNACVLLDHIVVGTRQEWADCRKKAGVSGHSPATKAAIAAARRKQGKYTVDQVIDIKNMTRDGVLVRDIVERTGVSRAMVMDIRSQKSWASIGNFFGGLGAR